MISTEAQQQLKLLLVDYQKYINFEQDLIYFNERLTRHLFFFHELDENRKIALFFICFKIGFMGLLSCIELLLALQNFDYETASKEIMDITAAIRIAAEIIKTGVIDSVHAQQIST